MMSIPILASSSNTLDSYHLELCKQNTSNEYPEKDNDREGHRISSRPIHCIISEKYGITISNLTAEITSYEIWDKEGNVCLHVSYEESEFIKILFTIVGEYQIRLISDNYLYFGTIKL